MDTSETRRRRDRGSGPRGRSTFRSAAAMLGAAAVVLWVAPTTELHAQQRVAGTVLDAESLRPVAGAHIQVQETSQGTLTDREGRFRLDVNRPEVTVTVTMLGYRLASQAVSAPATDLEFQLRRSALELDALVVTGTAGGTRSRALANPVSRVNVEDRVGRTPVTDVQQILSADVPGLRGFSPPGTVGSGTTLRIRGSSSMTLSSNPLVYVDGIRIDNNPRARSSRGHVAVNRLNDLTPEEIESIEVIRGPAAATLFGTEASSGVLVITTRRGRTGAPTVDVSVRQGANFLWRPNDVWPAAYGRDPGTGEIVRVHPVEADAAAGNSPFTTGHAHQYSVAVRGGAENFRYHLSGDFDRSEGIVDWNWRERFSLRSNLDVTPFETLELSTSLGYVRGETEFAGVSHDLATAIIWTDPSHLGPRTRGYRNLTPEDRRTIEPMEHLDRVVASGTVRHNPSRWLTQRFTMGLDVGNAENSLTIPRHPDGRSHLFGANSLGLKDVETNRTSYLTVDYAGTVTVPFSDAWVGQTSAGAQFYHKSVDVSRVRGREFPVPGKATVAASADREAFQDFIENKTFGVYVQQQLGWSERAFLTAALRGDDNSAFGANFNFVMYPKLSATWVVSDEAFWRGVWVDEIKLRAAYGRAGTQPDVFAARRLFGPVIGFGEGPGLTPLAVGNPDLRPEVGEEIELGFDASLLDGRASVEFTVYDQKTRDAIVRRPVPWSSGFPGVQFVNIGELTNRGLELGLRGLVLDRPGLGWDLGLNLSANRNEVTDLGGLPPIALPGLGRQRHVEGFPIAGFWDYMVVSAEFLPDGSVSARCRARDGGTVDCLEAEQVYWGPALPTWEGSASTTLRLGSDLRLFALVDFMGGHRKMSGDVWGSHVVFRNTLAIHERQDPILAAYDELVPDGSATGLFEAGFAKLRDVSLSYTLPTRAVERHGVSRASLIVSGRNLGLLWAAERERFGRKTVDVEAANQGGEWGGYYQTLMPTFTTVSTTVRVSF